jgi:anaerobic selenocysteine-containing dehydrogenase
MYERRTGFDLWRGLGVRLGQEEGLNMTFKEFVERLHAGSTSTGYIVGQEAKFKKFEKYGFGTPSGKVELYSNILEKVGYDPLPKYVEPPESPISSPEMTKEYPLTLMTGARVIHYDHSQFRQVKSLRQSHPDPMVQIHPETAKKFGIRDGDWVYIETPLGKIKQKAQFFSKMDPNLVQAEHAWWFPEKPSMEPNLGGIWESNVNILISDDPDICDPISGSWPHRTLCKIYKAE